MPVEVRTFGCRLNIAESEEIARLTREAGLSDAVVINTCAVTSEASKQARQAIRRLKREQPDIAIIVTGCGAQVEARAYAAMPQVARVIGNHEKMLGTTWEQLARSNSLHGLDIDPAEKIAVADIMAVRETALHLVEGFGTHTRGFVQVQNGCDHRCTFCIIPFGRGPSRSVPMGAVVDHVRRLVAGGTREVVLTGVDMTSYGTDLPGNPKLGALAGAILRHVPELERLRLSSIDAVEVDDGLRDLIASEPRLMPHLHLSLQSGDDLILRILDNRITLLDTTMDDLTAANVSFFITGLG